MLRTAMLAILVATLLVPAAISRADQALPPVTPENPDPWAKLCDPGMKWELEPLKGGKRIEKAGHEWPILRIETSDQRTVGEAKVCRLRWFVVEEKGKPIELDSKRMKKTMDSRGDTAPGWYDAQGAFKRARLVAITKRGLLVLQMEGQGAPSDQEIEKGLAKDWVTFPGKGSTQAQRELFRKGGSQWWAFNSKGGDIWCYGHKEIPCTADDSTCHAGVCFERDRGLVALYIDTGARVFPNEFTFYNMVGFPEYASWRPMPAPQGEQL